jgi:hypothetical protein
MAAIRTTVQTNGQIIRDRLGKDTEAGRKAAARNFRLAAKVIDAQMHAGVISTRDGTKQMRAGARADAGARQGAAEDGDAAQQRRPARPVNDPAAGQEHEDDGARAEADAGAQVQRRREAEA